MGGNASLSRQGGACSKAGHSVLDAGWVVVCDWVKLEM